MKHQGNITYRMSWKYIEELSRAFFLKILCFIYLIILNCVSQSLPHLFYDRLLIGCFMIINILQYYYYTISLQNLIKYGIFLIQF